MRQANRRKYHYIYKTTCKVTGKYYIGMHSTDNLEDGYLGSGKRLGYSLRKYGRDNHVCEILEHLPDRAALKAREAELVCEDKLTDPLCMNLKVGGEGGFEHINEKERTWSSMNDPVVRDKIGKAISNTMQRKIKEDPEYAKAHKVNCAKGLKRSQATIEEKYGVKSLFTLKNKDEAFQEKRKAKFKEIGFQQGEKNSQFGTCWVYSVEQQVSQKVKKTELQDYLNAGWQQGRKITNKNKE
jgi:hypothetical protein